MAFAIDTMQPQELLGAFTRAYNNWLYKNFAATLQID